MYSNYLWRDREDRSPAYWSSEKGSTRQTLSKVHSFGTWLVRFVDLRPNGWQPATEKQFDFYLFTLPGCLKSIVKDKLKLSDGIVFDRQCVGMDQHAETWASTLLHCLFVDRYFNAWFVPASLRLMCREFEMPSPNKKRIRLTRLKSILRRKKTNGLNSLFCLWTTSEPIFLLVIFFFFFFVFWVWKNCPS